MEIKKQLLSTDELLKLMELQSKLPDYQLEYGKLINAYLILEREYEHSFGEKGKVVTKPFESVDEHTKRDSKIIDEALEFIGDIKQSSYITGVDSNSTSKIENGINTPKTRYLPKAFEGDEREKVIQLYTDGYSLKEIDAKMKSTYNRAGTTLRELDWYRESAATIVHGRNVIKTLTGRLKKDAQAIADLGESGVVNEFKLHPIMATHFVNRANMIVNGTLRD